MDGGSFLVYAENAGPAGARLIFPPKYSPALNPIEQVFAKLPCCARPPLAPATPSARQSGGCSAPPPG
jgi:hypothetical protein